MNFLVAVCFHTFPAPGGMVISPGQFSGNGIKAKLWTNSFTDRGKTLLQTEEVVDLGG